MGVIDNTVEIELDKTRHLKLDLNAMANFEKATGKSFTEIGKDLSAQNIRALLWASLLHEEPKLSQNDVGGWIDVTNMSYVAKKLGELTNKSMPKSEANEGGEAPLA